VFFVLQRPVFNKIRPNFLLNRSVFGGRIFEKFSRIIGKFGR
jgi:hypothetical protein